MAVKKKEERKKKKNEARLSNTFTVTVWSFFFFFPSFPPRVEMGGGKESYTTCTSNSLVMLRERSVSYVS